MAGACGWSPTWARPPTVATTTPTMACPSRRPTGSTRRRGSRRWARTFTPWTSSSTWAGAPGGSAPTRWPRDGCTTPTGSRPTVRCGLVTAATATSRCGGPPTWASPTCPSRGTSWRIAWGGWAGTPLVDDADGLVIAVADCAAGQDVQAPEIGSAGAWLVVVDGAAVGAGDAGVPVGPGAVRGCDPGSSPTVVAGEIGARVALLAFPDGGS